MPSLGYLGKGFTIKPFYNLTSSGFQTTRLTYRYNYIHARLLAGYNLSGNKAWQLLPAAGPFFSYAMNGKAKIKNSDIPETDLKFSKEGQHRLDGGVTFAIYTLYKKHYVLGLQAEIGVYKVTGNDYGDRTRSYSFSLGYMF